MKKRKKKRISAGGIFFTIIIVFLSLILVGQGIYIMSEMKDSDRLYYADEDDYMRSMIVTRIQTIQRRRKRSVRSDIITRRLHYTRPILRQAIRYQRKSSMHAWNATARRPAAMLTRQRGSTSF